MSIKAWKRESRGSKIFDVINIMIMLVLIVIFVYPVLNVIAISFSDYKSVISGDVTIVSLIHI